MAHKSIVYFLLRFEDGAIKIGRSTNLKVRLTGLKPSHGPMRVLGIIEGDHATEAQLHSQFDDLRLSVSRSSRRGPRCEWFRAAPELLAFIDNNCSLPTWLEMPPRLEKKTSPGRVFLSSHA